MDVNERKYRKISLPFIFVHSRLKKNAVLKTVEKANPGSKAAEPGSYNTGSVGTP